ncbi:methyl accepting chemotaxis protein [Corallococcus coralloides DSM 2259]|uniref:Methyl accepting chemotaxis protein n=1 Tax=Corallococcus coralloides (strain ATCC 25202 / DSM 2259 / NBRC 100086 / M2) TaxID=1144275 RepID=H8MUN6_CORCM|nr:methyl-accepting chemotaxis protein [Corallococcus coralloides]AFE10566.1 methyl accepting chemotaxis protein [Corallococcus coralloides DSM 2259]
MKPSAALPVSFLRGLGLAPKFVLVTAVISASVALLLTLIATRQLESNLEERHASEGEAVALSLAIAAEQGVSAGMGSLQPLLETFREREDLAYIFIQDPTGFVLVHSFQGAFPENLKAALDAQAGAGKGRTRVVSEVRILRGGKTLRALDVSAAVAEKGRLGTVHVGMAREFIDARVNALRWEMLAFALLLVSGGVVLAALFGRSIVRPLAELTSVAGHIVSSGDLTRPIKTRGNDEVGRLSNSFSQMVGKLREVTVNLQHAATALTQSTDHLNASSTEQAQTISRQAAALQETQVTAQEIKQTSTLAAQKAESVLSVAERADALARAGEASIEQTMAGLNDIRAQVGEIAEKILELGERTRQIGGITQTVKDLADQSNMLALNAAIEAVRSGEHGKGFSVVAREIRALADQSIQATTRVRELLDDIANSVTAAVRITERGAERMEAGLAQVRDSGQNLRELSSIVQDNAAAVRQIAAAVNQQNVGINQITLAVNDLSKMMDDTVARIGSTGEAATTLQIISEQLSSAVGAYKVESKPE